MVRPATRRAAVARLREKFEVSERRACRVVGLSRATQRYESKREEPEGLRAAIRDVAYEHPRYGYRRVHWCVQRQGFDVGQRRVRRLYRIEGLGVRKRRKRRLKPVARRPMTPPIRPNQRWSMDFVHDQLSNGRCFRAFNVVDDFTRESVVIEVGTTLTATHVAAALDRAIAARGRCPERLVCDNGTEFHSLVFLKWAARHGIEIQFIQPGKPIQNAFAESFNGRFRDECLNTNWFSTLADARRLIGAWRSHYNDSRPHSSLGNRTPTEFRLVCF